VKPDKPVARRGDYTFGPCAPVAGRKLVEEYHYSKSASHRAFAFCISRDGEPVGAALFLPPLPPAAKKHAVSDPKKVTTLHRLVIRPGEPQNAASMLIAQALRHLRRDGRYDVVVTFADLSQGHVGTVYRATNATFVGLTKPEPYWVDPETGRRVSRKATRSRTGAEMRALGYERHISPGKFCFKWVLRCASADDVRPGSSKVP
jgi:hypothetical protein